MTGRQRHKNRQTEKQRQTERKTKRKSGGKTERQFKKRNTKTSEGKQGTSDTGSSITNEMRRPFVALGRCATNFNCFLESLKLC